LHALFTDTLGGESKLIIDDAATYSEIKSNFEQLANCNLNDVVVVAFSGHGTPTMSLSL